VVEIETSHGRAYAQYTHEHRDPPRMGALIRVLPGLHGTRPKTFDQLVLAEERFSVFVPLGAMLNQGIVRIVANEPVPAIKRAFPTFRSRTEIGGEVGPWWMWDGRREWLARPDEQGTPGALNEVWNDAMLIERIEADWHPPLGEN
jgi:hypothetical protein